MKKIIFILALGLLILPLMFNFANAEDILESGVSDALNPEQIMNTSAQLSSQWDYLSKEWKTILLGNVFVKGLDSFFQDINIVFLVLFANDYSLSLTLLLIILTWIYCLVVLSGALGDFSLFSKGVSFIISLGLVIVMAQMKIIEQPAKFVIWFIAGDKPWWMKLIIGLVVLTVLVVIAILIKKFGFHYKENKKKMEEEIARMKLEAGAMVGESFSKSVAEDE
jgi:hypothetical protein